MTDPQPPIVPGDPHAQPALADLLPPSAPTRKSPTPWIAGGIVALLSFGLGALLFGGGDGDTATATDKAAPAAVATTAAAAAAPNPNEVECVNIERAYNAWASFRPSTTEEIADLNEGGVQREMDNGKEFLGDVEGYADQPSKALAVAVAEFNFAMSLVNLQVTMSGEIKAAQARDAAVAGEKVNTAYLVFRSATCS